MSDLTAKELDLLERVRANPELRALFFRKVKGLKWFDALEEAGYFSCQSIPVPTPAKQEGYVNIPRLEIGEYLVKTAPELTGEEGSKYAPRFLEIISNMTVDAKERGFWNYHAWWQFAEVVSTIPSQFVSAEFINIVDYWLDDEFETGLVAEEVGTKWLAKLLDEENDHALGLAVKLLEILYKLRFVEQEIGGRKTRNALLRFDHYHADRITKKVACLAGRQLGRQAISIFHSKLEEMLNALGNDTWSAVWQPAIEEHDQNKYRDNPENLFVEGYRECLKGYLENHPEEACKYVAEMIDSPFQTVQRLAIYCITDRFLICREHAERLIDQRFLHSNYRHEFWHFIHRNYVRFEQVQKDNILGLIKNKTRNDENGVLLEGATAYEQATWLAAIKDLGEKESNLYKEAVSIAKTEPDHPDFSSYMSSGFRGKESPYSVDELSSLSIEEIVHTLASYEGGGGWREPGIEGLANTVKQLMKASPSDYYAYLAKFAHLDLAYVYAVIEAYSELWTGKANLPWDDIWRYLLGFCSAVVKEKRFWDEENSRKRDTFVANRYWIVGAIGRLLEAGAKSDEHAFHEKYHDEVESLITFLLENEKGEKFDEKSDAVSIAINSSRGHCIEALINLTLRSCRLSDRANNKDHSGTWARFQHYYDAELKRADVGEYEFSTLVTNYLPNFLYMSKDWVLANLDKIFDQTNYLKWLCAMQGYSYIGTVYQEIYKHLSEHGDLLKVLDDKNIKNRVEESAIQQIVVAHLNGFESFTEGNSLISVLINRKDFEELRQLIWFVWTLRKENDNKLRDMVYELWPLLMGVVDFSTREGRKLASNLCHWATFVDYLDEERETLLLAIAPYADESHNSHDLLKSIASLSNKQPFEANKIWLMILKGSAPDYPEEAIRQILTNLVAQGGEGKRLARETVSEYLKRGVERPSIWLRELTKDS
ncbi:MAG: hypothetical protein ACYCY5_02005 [Sulfuricella sp.]